MNLDDAAGLEIIRVSSRRWIVIDRTTGEQLAAGATRGEVTRLANLARLQHVGAHERDARIVLSRTR